MRSDVRYPCNNAVYITGKWESFLLGFDVELSLFEEFALREADFLSNTRLERNFPGDASSVLEDRKRSTS
jgi:hypothetical protein